MPSSSGNSRWRKTDESVRLVHCPDHCDQFLFYARTYTVGMGYQYSQTNQLIFNLKKSVGATSPELFYKRQAIQKFTGEVVELLNRYSEPLTLVPMPPSKARSHPEYDDRLEQVAGGVAAALPDIAWLPLLYAKDSIESSHSGSGRSADMLYDWLQVDRSVGDRYQEDTTIALLDDVLTSGAHFTAARRRLLEAFPDARVIGIFWAKAVSAGDFSAE